MLPLIRTTPMPSDCAPTAGFRRRHRQHLSGRVLLSVALMALLSACGGGRSIVFGYPNKKKCGAANLPVSGSKYMTGVAWTWQEDYSSVAVSGDVVTFSGLPTSTSNTGQFCQTSAGTLTTTSFSSSCTSNTCPAGAKDVVCSPQSSTSTSIALTVSGLTGATCSAVKIVCGYTKSNSVVGTLLAKTVDLCASVLSNVDCVGAWGAWGSCSATCGASAIESRTFAITTAASGTGASCVGTNGQVGTRSCGAAACPSALFALADTDGVAADIGRRGGVVVVVVVAGRWWWWWWWW